MEKWKMAMETNDRLESFGIYQVARQLFNDFWEDSANTIAARVATLAHIIGGLSKTIATIESKQTRTPASPITRHSSPLSSRVTRHPSPPE